TCWATSFWSLFSFSCRKGCSAKNSSGSRCLMGNGTTYRHLLSQGRIGKATVKNRVIMAPMETNLPSVTGEVNDRLIAYYEERARGGVGAIIVEFTCVDSVTGKGSQTQLHLDRHGFISGH